MNTIGTGMNGYPSQPIRTEKNVQDAYERGFIDGMQKQMQSSVDRAVNTSLDRIGNAMDEVAHRFAHRLALDLECVLARYQGPWYDEAWDTLGQYRSEMNKLHEQVSPTFMGEPLIRGDK
jgi:hypothetical protein